MVETLDEGICAVVPADVSMISCCMVVAVTVDSPVDPPVDAVVFAVVLDTSDKATELVIGWMTNGSLVTSIAVLVGWLNVVVGGLEALDGWGAEVVLSLFSSSSPSPGRGRCSGHGMRNEKGDGVAINDSVDWGNVAVITVVVLDCVS